MSKWLLICIQYEKNLTENYQRFFFNKCILAFDYEHTIKTQNLISEIFSLLKYHNMLLSGVLGHSLTILDVAAAVSIASRWEVVSTTPS